MSVESNVYDAMLEKAVELRKNHILTREAWFEALGQYREAFKANGKTNENFKEYVLCLFFYLSKLKNLKSFNLFLQCDELQKQGKSYSEIAQSVGISKSKVCRVFKNADKPRHSTAQDIADWEGLSVSTVKKALKGYKRE